jgi:DNA-binding MarR family transcriptional regulator
MKELETHLKLGSQERIELNVKKKKEIEYVLEGTIQPIKGHFIWECNEENGEIKKAEFKRNTFSTTLPPEELIIKADCVYIPALNAANAKKHYLKDNRQSSYYVKEAPIKLQNFCKNIANRIDYTQSTFRVLFYLISLSEYENFISIDVKTIAENMNMSPLSVKRATKQLSDDNVIKKIDHPSDKRRIDYFLNPMAMWRGKSDISNNK